ncbi:hypothetical protein SEPCBS57363_006095 [Sporothrix epigloea]|uniref:Uncharacterized protein n=1 Tax=Sporothrix epigloea TaxID=1892477 RepID=A0ABP0E331_9PEZI
MQLPGLESQSNPLPTTFAKKEAGTLDADTHGTLQTAPVTSTPPQTLLPRPHTRDSAHDLADENSQHKRALRARRALSKGSRATARAYRSKAREFEDFFISRNFGDGATATETKLLCFLGEAVANRPLGG